MFFSGEPGYYEEGHYGIRLESIVRVVSREFGDTTYGERKQQTERCFPIMLFEPKLIDHILLVLVQNENSYMDLSVKGARIVPTPFQQMLWNNKELCRSLLDTSRGIGIYFASG